MKNTLRLSLLVLGVACFGHLLLARLPDRILTNLDEAAELRALRAEVAPVAATIALPAAPTFAVAEIFPSTSR